MALAKRVLVEAEVVHKLPGEREIEISIEKSELQSTKKGLEIVVLVMRKDVHLEVVRVGSVNRLTWKMKSRKLVTKIRLPLTRDRHIPKRAPWLV